MGTPKRFQLATLWDNDAGFHTNEGSKYHQRGTWTPSSMHRHAYMYVKTHTCIQAISFLCGLITHALHTKWESQFPTVIPGQSLLSNASSHTHTHTDTHWGQHISSESSGVQIGLLQIPSCGLKVSSFKNSLRLSHQCELGRDHLQWCDVKMMDGTIILAEELLIALFP